MTYSPLSTQYEQQWPRLRSLATALEVSLREAFKGNESVVLVDSRAKSASSFLRKAAKMKAGGPAYPVPMLDVQDQVGCRIVVRSPRVTSGVLDQLRQMYHAIEDQSRPALYDPATFGYSAWHLICLIPEPLRRRHRVETTTLEIQVSTPFQFAWSVMEHDLLYKPERETEATYQQRRAVYAAAALAYAADQLFELAEAPSQADETAGVRAPTLDKAKSRAVPSGPAKQRAKSTKAPRRPPGRDAATS